MLDLREFRPSARQRLFKGGALRGRTRSAPGERITLTNTTKFLAFDQISDTVNGTIDLSIDAATLAMLMAKALGQREHEDAFRDLAIGTAVAVELGKKVRTRVN